MRRGMGRARPPGGQPRAAGRLGCRRGGHTPAEVHPPPWKRSGIGLAKRRTVLLRVDGAEGADFGADVAVLEVTAELLETWLAELDVVAALKRRDPELGAVEHWDGRVDYLHAPDLWDELLLDDDWVVLDDDQAEALADVPNVLDAGLDQPGGVRTEADRRRTTDDFVAWRAYPKYGGGQYTTAWLDQKALQTLRGALS